MENEHYGDSLDTTPGYFFMKKMWMEDLENLENLEKVGKSLIFVDQPRFNKEKLFKGINLTLIRKNNEENILRSPMGTGGKRKDNRQMDLRRETS